MALQSLLKSSDGCFKSTPSEMLKKAVRKYEMIRAPRTHDMVALARYNVNLVCCNRTWLVSPNIFSGLSTLVHHQ